MADSGDNKNAQSTSKAKNGAKELTHEEVVAKFQELRQQQRITVTKMNEFDMEKREHELVIDTLKKTEPSRKCYRLIGGVLVEKTVEEVLPTLIYNCEQISKIEQSLQKQLEVKGRELQEFREKHNIKVRGEEDRPPSNAVQEGKASAGGTSVLVAQGRS